MGSYTPVTDVAAVRRLLDAPGGELRRAVPVGDGEPVALIRTWADPDRVEVVAPYHQYDLDEALRDEVRDASGTWDALGVVGWLLARGLVDEAKSVCT